MKSTLPKKSVVVFLLVHGVFINLFLFPILFFYSIYYSVDYLSLIEWIKSVCLNLVSWQVVSYSLKNNGDESTTIQIELKKFSSLVWLNNFLLTILSRKKTRVGLYNSSIWFVLFVNFLLPIISSILFNIPLTLQTFGLLFISFQIVTFIIHFLNYNFPQDFNDTEKRLVSPWFIEVLIRGLTQIKIT